MNGVLPRGGLESRDVFELCGRQRRVPWSWRSERHVRHRHRDNRRLAAAAPGNLLRKLIPRAVPAVDTVVEARRRAGREKVSGGSSDVEHVTWRHDAVDKRPHTVALLERGNHLVDAAPGPPHAPKQALDA